MNVALIHDWIIDREPEEDFLEILCELFPEAPVYTLFQRAGKVPEMASREIRTSLLHRFPGIRFFPSCYAPLFPTAIEHFDLRPFDLVISNSRYLAKGVLTQPETCHVCLLHPAVLDLWYPSETDARFSLPRFYPFIRNYYRLWDVVSSKRVDGFITTSDEVERHIRKYYRRQDVRVLDPTVDRPTLKERMLDACVRIFEEYRQQEKETYPMLRRPEYRIPTLK